MTFMPFAVLALTIGALYALALCLLDGSLDRRRRHQWQRSVAEFDRVRRALGRL